MNARAVVALSLALVIAGCAAPRRPAPVVDRTPPAPPAARASVPEAAPSYAPTLVPAERPETYTVKRGETLYGIALDHGLDYRELAEWNEVSNPNFIREGQVLRTRRPDSTAAVVQVSPVSGPAPLQPRPLPAQTEVAKPAPTVKADAVSTKSEPRAARLPYSEENLALLTKPQAARVQPTVAAPAQAVEPPAKIEPPRAEAPAKGQEADGDALEWSWPAGGPVLARFSDPANKGVDIGGKKGEPVYASASGRVVYSGEGLRGYGKLIIIKHNNTYLSAYAHNDSVLVREGQTVVKGQKIAEIGSTGTDQPKLHFEIRRMGKPVDPLKFLPEKPS